ncbi:MAG: ABC transporter ATP-binding protein [Oscillospiraceae bacterium]|nr:ABC transporter ATP-binding protein [Oscillospiraceae bacterium]
MIEVKNLVKDYGSHLAVKDLSFTVEDGQIYGFLGPNGAGKTTTMNIICGYIGATSGEVLINGKNVAEEPLEAKKLIGYLPEQPPLYQEMTPREYLSFAAEIKGLARGEAAAEVERAMEVTGVSDMADRLIRNLSKGYKQRVGLAQAIIGLPPIIILDEPTVGLDPKQIAEIRELIKALGKKHTVILSSHILSEVSAVCDKVMIISRGRLVACDTPQTLEQMMQGSGEIDLSVRGGKKAVEAALKKLRNCEMRFKKSAGEERAELTLSAGDSRDIREEVFFALAEAKLPILAMSPSRASLEEVFLDLTAGGASESSIETGLEEEEGE